MSSQKLHQGLETVCLTYHNDHSVYAIGSRSHTTILDARSLQPIQNKNILSLFPTCGKSPFAIGSFIVKLEFLITINPPSVGIRSVSFRGDILTIGTGTGAILFYDLRAAKYLRSNQNEGEIIFKTNSGWVVSINAKCFFDLEVTFDSNLDTLDTIRTTEAGDG